MSGLPLFRIGQAASLAGLSAAAVRAWERRYGIVKPQRTASRYRLYSLDDVEVLQGAATLVAAGHSIGDVATRPRDEIRNLAATRASSRTHELQMPESIAAHDCGFDTTIDLAIAAAKKFDRARFEAALLPVLGLGVLNPADACEQVLFPLLRKIGAEWAAGRLDIVAEHFASSIIGSKLLHYLDFLPRPSDGPLVVCACPGHERHELGLLAFAVHAASSGWRVVVFGAGTPFGEAVAATNRLGAELLAVALTMDPSVGERQRMAEALAEARAARPLSVLAGGRGAERAADFLASLGIDVTQTFRPRLPGPQDVVRLHRDPPEKP